MAKNNPAEITGKWIVQVYQEQHVNRKHFQSETSATEWAAKFAREVNFKAGSDFEELKFSDLLDRYCIEESPKKEHHRKDIRRVKFFKTSVDPRTGGKRYPLVDVYLRDLSRADFLGFRKQRLEEVGDGTFIRDWSLFHSATKIAVYEWGWLHRNPMQGIRIPPEPEHRKRRITQDEVTRISEEILAQKQEHQVTMVYEKTFIIFQLAIETAMRKSEIIALRRNEVFLDRGYLKVSGLEKNARKTPSAVREVPLTQHARKLLRIALDNRWDREFIFRISPERLQGVFKAAAIRADVADIHFHDTRHEGISRLAQFYRALDLARIVGHKDIQSLLTYYQPTIDQLVETLDKFQPGVQSTPRD